jgi:hypothetical protein
MIEPGCEVYYITHDNKAEKGIVKRANDTFVFVNYFVNNVLQETAQATRPEDLYYLKNDVFCSILDLDDVFNKLNNHQQK